MTNKYQQHGRYEPIISKCSRNSSGPKQPTILGFPGFGWTILDQIPSCLKHPVEFHFRWHLGRTPSEKHQDHDIES